MLKVLSRSLNLVLLLFFLVLAAMFFVNAENYRTRSQELRQSRSVVAGTKVAEDGSSSLAQPVPVKLQGELIATFVGGRDLAVKSSKPVAGHQQFYVVGYDDSDYASWQGNVVEIKGVVVGLTCAYAKTVFGGCVPEIMASNIAKISK